MRPTFRTRLASWIAGRSFLAPVSATVDESPGWSSLTTGLPHDRDAAEVSALYTDALTAWRKNPIAFRIVSIFSDYVIGDHIVITSSNRRMAKFITEFWDHPKNLMDLRLEAMCDELSRSGDLFVLLFRNPQDGMSYLRFVTKDRITKIKTSENDWENELSYEELTEVPGETRTWLSPSHPEALNSPAVMLHYAINRPIGALLGESDLVTMLPWLQRYSRMLEDRIRLHWAVKAFLWVVTVPTNKVAEKREQYRTPPDAGSIIVKDESENWEVFTPNLAGFDAQYDMKAVRNMIDAGSGFPPHWRGEAGDANLATAQAMQGPTERHLLRRQQYFTYLLEDILFHAYQRSAELGSARLLPAYDYDKLFLVQTPEISRWDNESLSRAANDLTTALQTLATQLGGPSETYNRLSLRLLYKFMAEPQSETAIDQIIAEAKAALEKAAALAEAQAVAQRAREDEIAARDVRADGVRPGSKPADPPSGGK
jgi:hypothetical protein